MIKANQQLIYTNNSPDELRHVFFIFTQMHLNQISYLDKFRKSNKMLTKLEDEKKEKSVKILSVKSNNKNLDIEIDNTIMKVYLTEPLKSGETIKFDIDFESHFGGEESSGNVREMKTYTEYGNKHFNGVHWYPRISVCNDKFGWTESTWEKNFMAILDV